MLSILLDTFLLPVIMKLNYLHGEHARRTRGDNSIERALYDELIGDLQNDRFSATWCAIYYSFYPLGSAFLLSSKSEWPMFRKGSDRVKAEIHSNSGDCSDSTLSTEELDSEVGAMEHEKSDFVTKILQRLRNTEEREKILRKQISEVIVENELLRSKSNIRAVSQRGDTEIDELSMLHKENASLKNRVNEMENFLRDYGLEWVGYEEGTQEHKCPNEIDDEQSHLQRYHLFLSKVEELNSVVRREPAQIRTDSTRRRGNFIHYSEVCEKISIVYYKNGLLVQRGPFRHIGIEYSCKLSFCLIWMELYVDLLCKRVDACIKRMFHLF